MGELDPDQIHTPGIYINRVIKGKDYSKAIENLYRDQIVGLESRCLKASKELKEGDYVNLE